MTRRASERLSISKDRRAKVARARRWSVRRPLLESLEDRMLLSTGIDFSSLGSELSEKLAVIQSGIDLAYSTAADIPVLGEQLQNNSTLTNAIAQLGMIATTLKSLGDVPDSSEVITDIQNAIFPLIAPDVGTLGGVDGPRLAQMGAGYLTAAATSHDISVTTDDNGSVTVSMLLYAKLAAASEPANFDVGIPGFLSLKTSGNVDLMVGLNFLLSFTYDQSTDTLTMNTGDLKQTLDNPDLPDDALSISLFASLSPQFTATGLLNGLLSATVTDQGTTLTGDLGVSIDPTSAQPNVQISATAHVALGLSLEFGPGVLPFDPTITTDFHLDWTSDNTDLGASDDDDNSFGTLSNVGFDSVTLAAPGLFSGFLGTIIGDIQKITEPLQPIVDLSNEVVPGLSELGIKVTVRQMLDKAGLLPGAVDNALDLIKLINQLPSTDNGDMGGIMLGSFSLGSDVREQKLENTLSVVTSAIPPGLFDAADAASGGLLSELTGGDTTDITASSPFQFPFFDDPLDSVFKMILGQDTPLIKFTMPTLDLPLDADLSFGLEPLLSLFLNAGVDVKIDASVGYDTYGIREIVKDVSDGNTSFLTLAGDLLDGFYIDNSPTPETDDQGQTYTHYATGVDIQGELEAGGEAFGLSIMGGLYADVDFHIDPTLDDSSDPTEVRIGKFLQSFVDGDTVFATSGSIYVNLSASLGFDTPFGEVTAYSVNLAYAELANFNTPAPSIEPPDPNDPGTIRIKIDPSAGNETIEVKQVKLVDAQNDSMNVAYDQAIEVDYPDHKQQYLTAHYVNDGGNWVGTDLGHYNLIATDGSDSSDQTIVVDDVVGDAEGTPVNAVLIGGDGDDTLEYRGTGHAVIIGGGGNNTLGADIQNGVGEGSLEFGNTIDPGQAYTIPFTVPNWVQMEIAAQTGVSAGGTDALVGSGGNDFLEGGSATNTFQEMSDGGMLIGEGTNNTVKLVETIVGAPAAPGGGVVVAGPGTNSLVIDRENAPGPDSLTLQADSVSGKDALVLTGNGTNMTVHGFTAASILTDGGSIDVGDLSSLGTFNVSIVSQSTSSTPTLIRTEAPATPKAGTVTPTEFQANQNLQVANVTSPDNLATAAANMAENEPAVSVVNTATLVNLVIVGLAAQDTVTLAMNGQEADIADIDSLGPETVRLDGGGRTAESISPINTISIAVPVGASLMMTNGGANGAVLSDTRDGGRVDILGSLPQDITVLTIAGFSTGTDGAGPNTIALDVGALEGTFAVSILGNAGEPSAIIPVENTFTVTAVNPLCGLILDGGAGTNVFTVINQPGADDATIDGGSGFNSLQVFRPLTIAADPDNLTLGAATGSRGAYLHVTGTATDLSAYGMNEVRVFLYGSNLDVQDLAKLGGSQVDVTALASPVGDANHVVIEPSATGAPDDVVVGAADPSGGTGISDISTQTTFGFLMDEQDDVRIKLNGGGTTTIANFGAAAAFGTLYLDGRTRADAASPAPNAITLKGTYNILEPPPSGYHPVGDPTGLQASLGTDAVGEPIFQGVDDPVVIQGSLSIDTTIFTVPFQLDDGSTNPPDNVLNLDGTSLEGSLEVDVVAPPFQPRSDVYSFDRTDINIAGVSSQGSVTVQGVDVLSLPATFGYASLEYPYLGQAIVTVGTGLLSKIQGNVTLNHVQLVINDSAATAPQILTLTSQTFTGWMVPQGVARPTLTIDSTVYNSVLIQGGAGDSVDVQGTPQFVDIALPDPPPDGTLMIQNSATSITPDSVYVMGTDRSATLEVTGDFSFFAGRRLNPDGTITDVGDVAGIASSLALDYTGTNVSQVVFDASNDNFPLTAVIEEGPGALIPAGDLGFLENLAGGDLVFNDTHVDFTLDSTRLNSSYEGNGVQIEETDNDSIHLVSETAAPGGFTPVDGYSIYATTAAVTVAGNGSTQVSVPPSEFNGGDVYDAIRGDISVDDSHLNVDALSTTVPNLPNVVLTGSTLTGMTIGTIKFSNLTGLAAEFPYKVSDVTVDDTPAGITTGLTLYGTILNVLGTTGPLTTSNTPSSPETVIIGNGTLANIKGSVTIDGDGYRTTAVKVDDHADVAHTKVMFDLTAGVSTITGMAPASIAFNGGGTWEIDGSAGSNYTDIYTPSETTLFAGKGSAVSVFPIGDGTGISGLDVVGAGQVTIGNTDVSSIGTVRVYADASRPSDETALTIDASGDAFGVFTLGDDLSGYNSYVLSYGVQFGGTAHNTVLYQGNTTVVTLKNATTGTVNDTGAAGATINGPGSVTVAATTGPLVLEPSGSASVTVGAGGSVQSLRGQVSLLAASSLKKPLNLTIDDSADTTGRSGGLAPQVGGLDSLTGLAPAPILYTAAWYNLTVNGGVGGNSFVFIDTISGAPIVLNLGGGNDWAEVLTSATGGFAAVTVNGGPGMNTLAFGGDGDLPTVTNMPSTTIPGSGSIQASYPPAGPIDVVKYSSISAIADATTTSLVSSTSGAAATVGTPVTFTAHVAASVSGATASGSVSFVDTTTNIALGTVALSNGSATVTTSALDAGSHTIVATFTPSGGFVGGTATLLQVVSAPAYTDVTDQLTVTPYGPVYNHSTHMFVQTIKMTTTSDFTGPLAIEVSGIPKGAFEGILINGTLFAPKVDPLTGNYYVDFSAPGGDFTSTLPISISLAFSALPGPYTYKIFQGLS